MSRRIGTRKAVPKTDGTEAAEGYTVGFRRPPAATRFKPGVSGNPTGRPKGKTPLRAMSAPRPQLSRWRGKWGSCRIRLPTRPRRPSLVTQTRKFWINS
jgi:hypothetical protein